MCVHALFMLYSFRSFLNLNARLHFSNWSEDEEPGEGRSDPVQINTFRECVAFVSVLGSYLRVYNVYTCDVHAISALGGGCTGKRGGRLSVHVQLYVVNRPQNYR